MTRKSANRASRARATSSLASSQPKEESKNSRRTGRVNARTRVGIGTDECRSSALRVSTPLTAAKFASISPRRHGKIPRQGFSGLLTAKVSTPQPFHLRSITPLLYSILDGRKAKEDHRKVGLDSRYHPVIIITSSYSTHNIHYH